MFEISGTPRSIDPKTIDKIIDLATETVDQFGTGLTEDILGGEPKYKSGYFIDRNHGVDGLDPNKIPSLSVNIPVGKMATEAAWKAELTFGYQDADLSSHMLVRKDNTIVVSGYNGRPDQYLTDDGANQFSERLTQLQGEIADDFIPLFTEPE